MARRFALCLATQIACAPNIGALVVAPSADPLKDTVALGASMAPSAVLMPVDSGLSSELRAATFIEKAWPHRLDDLSYLNDRFADVRWIGSTRLVVVKRDGNLYVVSTDGEPTIRAKSEGYCKPIAAVAPVYVCTTKVSRGVELRLGRVTPLAEFVVERTVLREGAEDSLATTASANGGVYLQGSCEPQTKAERESLSTFCVRSEDGHWTTRSVNTESHWRMHQRDCDLLNSSTKGRFTNFPSTGEFWPTSDGTVAVSFNSWPGCVSFWIEGQASLTTIRGTYSYFTFRPWEVHATRNGAFAWPMYTRSREWCRFDPAIDGTVTKRCVAGALHVAGPYGLLQKPDGTFAETVDAGKTWNVAWIPRHENESRERGFKCWAMGCAIGKTLRLGWGTL